MGSLFAKDKERKPGGAAIGALAPKAIEITDKKPSAAPAFKPPALKLPSAGSAFPAPAPAFGAKPPEVSQGISAWGAREDRSPALAGGKDSGGSNADRIVSGINALKKPQTFEAQPAPAATPTMDVGAFFGGLEGNLTAAAQGVGPLEGIATRSRTARTGNPAAWQGGAVLADSASGLPAAIGEVAPDMTVQSHEGLDPYNMPTGFVDFGRYFGSNAAGAQRDADMVRERVRGTERAARSALDLEQQGFADRVRDGSRGLEYTGPEGSEFDVSASTQQAQKRAAAERDALGSSAGVQTLMGPGASWFGAGLANAAMGGDVGERLIDGGVGGARERANNRANDARRMVEERNARLRAQAATNLEDRHFANSGGGDSESPASNQEWAPTEEEIQAEMLRLLEGGLAEDEDVPAHSIDPNERGY